MRWLVEAADTKTGKETEITVEALTEADAERLARYNGLFVSKVCRAGWKPAPVVEYAKLAAAAGPPELERLGRRARGTRTLGVVLTLAGWMALAAAVGWFAYGVLRAGWGNWSSWRDWLPAAAGGPAWRAALVGAGAITAGSVLRLLAAVALVVHASPFGETIARARGECNPPPGATRAGEDGAAGEGAGQSQTRFCGGDGRARLPPSRQLRRVATVRLGRSLALPMTLRLPWGEGVAEKSSD